MPQLYIIAGCNGAGKTTASLTVLPEMLNCHEFVNADMIAFGLSPLNPTGVAVAAGRIMLSRIKDLLDEGRDFAFETTLSTRSYVPLIHTAKEQGYTVTLLFFWLYSAEEALMRVAERVRNGGHDIPSEVVKRRYKRGIQNFHDLYRELVDAWLLFDNSDETPELIAKGDRGFADTVINSELWNKINRNGF
jgi:predicted ABC-type ATPase